MTIDDRRLPAVHTIAELWGRDERCWKCGAWEHLERCHLVGRAKGGPDDAWNLAILCRGCHAAQPEEFTVFLDAVAWLNDGLTGEESLAGVYARRAIGSLIDEELTPEERAEAIAEAAEITRRCGLAFAESAVTVDDARWSLRVRLLGEAMAP